MASISVNNMDRPVILYTLAHPITNEIRYVGKTSGSLQKRLREHRCMKGNSRNNNWLLSLNKLGLSPVIEELDTVSTSDWVNEEKFYISYFKYLGFRLTNITSGGEGIEHTPEVRRKISLALTGKKVSHETKGKLRELNRLGIIGTRGIICKPEHVAARVASRKRKNLKWSVESRYKLSLAQAEKRKPVLQLDKNNNIIKEWASVCEAASQFGNNKAHI